MTKKTRVHGVFILTRLTESPREGAGSELGKSRREHEDLLEQAPLRPSPGLDHQNGGSKRPCHH